MTTAHVGMSSDPDLDFRIGTSVLFAVGLTWFPDTAPSSVVGKPSLITLTISHAFQAMSAAKM